MDVVINLALKVAEGIVDHAALAVTNAEECKLLASLAGQTMPFLQTLKQLHVNDPSLLASLDLILDALNAADRVIEDCCKSTVLKGMVFASRSERLKHVAQKRNTPCNSCLWSVCRLWERCMNACSLLKATFAKPSSTAWRHRRIRRGFGDL